MTVGAARVLRKGQITLPQEVRDALGLKEGDTLLFTAEEGELRAVRAAMVPENQLWFYQPEWQRRIAAAEGDFATGRETTVGSLQALRRYLSRLSR